MTSEREIGPEISPLSYAMAERFLAEDELFAREMDRIFDKPHVSVDVANLQAQIAYIASRFEDITQHPYKEIELAEQIAGFAANAGFSHSIENDQNPNIQRISKSDLDVDKIIGSFMVKMGTAMEGSVLRFLATRNVAPSVAEEHGKSLEEVYRERSLFEEAFSRTTTPQEYLERAQRIARSLTAKDLLEIISSSLRNDSENRATIDLALKILPLEPFIEMQLSLQNNARMLVTAKQLRRFWGAEGEKVLSENGGQ